MTSEPIRDPRRGASISRTEPGSAGKSMMGRTQLSGVDKRSVRVALGAAGNDSFAPLTSSSTMQLLGRRVATCRRDRTRRPRLTVVTQVRELHAGSH